MQAKHRTFRLAAFTFGSFAFGWVFGILFHELGHAIPMWLTGGKVDRIEITPFSWSYTYYGSSPRFPKFTTWSGVLLGSALGLLVLLVVGLLRKQDTPYAVPFLFLGVAPMLNGGSYFILDLYVTRTGDAHSLIMEGTPEPLLLGAGIMLLTISTFSIAHNLHRIGITHSDSFKKRLAVLGGGILSYFAAGLVVTILQVRGDLTLISLAFLIAPVFVLLVSWISRQRPHLSAAAHIRWKHALYAAVLGLTAIVVPYMVTH